MLRILWLSPWLRPLARVYAESLIALGADVRLVTSDRHPESTVARDYETVLDPRPKTLSTWESFARAVPSIRRFKPEIVVSELVRDPRWMALAPGVPRVDLVHDDRPHDDSHVLPRWEQSVFKYWSNRAIRNVAFSHYVAEMIGSTLVVPLTSDLPDDQVPHLARAGERKDFIVIGRVRDYKNLDVCLTAWREHTSGPGWRGDTLRIIGDGDVELTLPSHVVWHRGQFKYSQILPIISRAKGSVAHYRRPSQSGVQVLSMQLGVTPIVSPEGALPEFQPMNEKPVGVDDVRGLTAAFDSLADPLLAAARGAACREHYQRRYSAPVSAAILYTMLQNTATQRARRP